MAYKIIVSPKAEKEIDNAFEYYAEFPKSAGKSFNKQLSDSYKKLKLNPFFEKRYLNVRVLPFPKYPYIIIFRIDEIKKKFLYSPFSAPIKIRKSILKNKI